LYHFINIDFAGFQEKKMLYGLICRKRQVPGYHSRYQNMLVLGNLPQVYFDRDKRRFMGIRQTFKISPHELRTYIQDVDLFIEQDGFIQLRGRHHVDKHSPAFDILFIKNRRISDIPRRGSAAETEPDDLFRGSTGIFP
jgi:hypothetical protein